MKRKRIFITWIFVIWVFYISIHAYDIDYSDCITMQDAIEKETQHIQVTSNSDHDDLSELYFSSGESFLIVGEYENA